MKASVACIPELYSWQQLLLCEEISTSSKIQRFV